ncbi:MAG: ATP-grasp domain-containing protein [Acidobacteria bacterium]|nr:ATP-grasp domain-containing protein [Acidobacteriota bacterium]MCA1609872.1 ATP-grasp domain-containing protein [Acidobacteriota bacterium]
MRLLVANRGEIALRIFRACRDLGIETVAVFSDADRLAPHVAAADYAVRLGPAPAAESYLSIPALLDAARKTSATLIHPGYGFLAENAGFARACVRAGLTFVGPAADAIEAMGSKTESRARMRAAGVPIVPGMTSPARDAAEIARFGHESGFPILLKASAGGGGKGMRRVENEAEAAAAFARTSSEAKLSFGDGAVYAEKLIERPRHVEVQVVGDRQGRIVAVGERECSIQRRHQKVIEECPSPVVDGALRARLSEAAVAAARAVRYTSCGTVEFLLAPDGSFYFLEMNTRLQVEHPVTEEVFGVDLAVEMIRIARGEPLSFGDLAPRGHAIECRIYAEDPRQGFAPSPGTITALRLPAGPGIRNDVGVEAGSVVPIDYDPMLGKLIVHGPDRQAALSRLRRALSEYEISGVETTLPLFRRLCELPEFLSADFDVQWLDRRLAGGLFEQRGPSKEEILLAAAGAARPAPKETTNGARPDEDGSLWRRESRRDLLR